MQRLSVVILAVCALCLFLGLMPVHGESDIYDSVLRLHVIANSDIEEDQELKLKVRDAVIAESRIIFSESPCEDREEAEALVNKNIERLEKAAEKAVIAEGYSYPVSIELGEEDYPTKNYEGLCFPSGSYTSLRVIIGEGEGQNWWCVLFPPMCLSAASNTSNEESFISVGLNKDQYGIITENNNPTYKVRFKLLEVIEDAIP